MLRRRADKVPRHGLAHSLPQIGTGLVLMANGGLIQEMAMSV